MNLYKVEKRPINCSRTGMKSTEHIHHTGTKKCFTWWKSINLEIKFVFSKFEFSRIFFPLLLAYVRPGTFLWWPYLIDLLNPVGQLSLWQVMPVGGSKFIQFQLGWIKEFAILEPMVVNQIISEVTELQKLLNISTDHCNACINQLVFYTERQQNSPNRCEISTELSPKDPAAMASRYDSGLRSQSLYVRASVW